MRPENDKTWAMLPVKAKALFLSKLFYYDEYITEAINSREAIQLTVDGAINVTDLSRKDWRDLSSFLLVNNDGLVEVNNKITVTIGEKNYIINAGRAREGFKSAFEDDILAEEKIRSTPLVDQVIIDSILSSSIANVVTTVEPHVLNRIAETSDLLEQEAWRNEAQNLYTSLRILSFKAYVSSYINNTIVSDKKYYAKRVFDTIYEQLTTHHFSQKQVKLLDDILEETAKGAYGELDREKYIQLLNKLPLKYSWGRIIGFACLAIFSVALVSAATLLAITTFGLATPLVAFGIVIATNAIVGGYAVATGVIGAALAGAAIFFSAKGKKSDLNHQAEDYLKEYLSA